MLTCITCSKQKADDDGDEDAPRGTPSTKDAVKSLTSQIKDIALKVSGGQKGKAGVDDARFRDGERSHWHSDSVSDGLREGSSGSTPAWDYNRAAGHLAKPPRAPGSSRSNNMLPGNDAEPKEWTAQVEPGVQITFVSLSSGGNDLKRIRFSREMFNKWEAQRWWGENFDRIMELYNVQRFNQQALNTPGRSEDGRDSSYSRMGAFESPRMTQASNKEWTPRYRFPETAATHHGYPRAGEMEAARTTTSSRDEASVSVSNASEVETEWIEEDEPGVYITIRQLMDGTRELRRVRFSRERFGEVHAKLWWDTNRDRIQTQYLGQH